MRWSKSIRDIPECRNGCLLLIHTLLPHLVVAHAIVARVPAPVLLAVSVYIAGVIVSAQGSAAEIAVSLAVVSHDGLTRMLTDHGNEVVGSVPVVQTEARTVVVPVPKTWTCTLSGVPGV